MQSGLSEETWQARYYHERPREHSLLVRGYYTAAQLQRLETLLYQRFDVYLPDGYFGHTYLLREILTDLSPSGKPWAWLTFLHCGLSGSALALTDYGLAFPALLSERH